MFRPPGGQKMLVTLDKPMAHDQADLAEDHSDLSARFARGEAAAFDEVVRLYQPRVARLVQRLLGWRGDVEDIVQETFLVALSQCKRFRGESSLATWLSAIAIRKCRTHRWRRLLRWRWLNQRSVESRKADAADAGAIVDETAQRVRRAVQELPQGMREAVVLYYLEGMSVAEMSKVLGATVNAIDVRLHRAREKLRETLSEE